jgi:hypothetical protein
MKKIFKVILFFLISISAFFLIDRCNNKRFNQEMDDLKLHGKIVNKYIDKTDHNRPKIVITNYMDSVTFDLANETSGLFDYSQIGDSVLKIESNRNVKIYNSYKDSIFVLTF